MWIRSQRRNALVNINFMRVINDGNFCLICGATTDGCDCELGVYSTEKKALRVLDEIQEKLNVLIQFTLHPSAFNGKPIKYVSKEEYEEKINKVWNQIYEDDSNEGEDF